MEITEEQIKEAHNAACSQWKQKIEKWFPECFNKELEVGKWYKSEDYEYIIFNLKEINKNICFGYGANGSKWYDNTSFMPVKSAIPASAEEVESMLINEAEKRGFKEGVTVLCARDDSKWTLLGDTASYSYDRNNLTDGSGAYWFWKGKWATIVETPKEMTLEEIEKQLGHKVKIVS